MTVTKQPFRASLAAFIGTMVEWYDYYIYGTAAALVFGVLFFPGHSSFISTIASFATFAIGFFVRPLGAAIFGHIGDRIGRKKSLMVTLIMMGVSTFCIGLLPDYHSIGVLAPVLLITLRIIQGLAVGGEWGGAVLMAGEHAPTGKQNFFASFAQWGSPAGLILSIFAFSLVSRLNEAAFIDWGWRLPFLASSVMLLVGFLIRVGVNESPEFQEIKKAKQLSDNPVKDAWRFSGGLILLAVGANALGIAGGYFTNTFMLTYGIQYLGLSRSVILDCIFVVAIVQFCSQPVGAWLAMKIGVQRFLLSSSLITILLPYPMFLLVDTGNTLFITLGISIAMIGLCTFYSVIAGYVASVFPARYRYTGISMAYQISGAIFGGLTPIIGSVLAEKFSGHWWPLAIFFSLISLCSLISVALMGRWAARQKEYFKKHTEVKSF
ncbi:MFS transporter [Enterobacter hormaechei]|uniref:MFS transporter n=1 Tax=Enterobacter hormaechei TaxID=158836 RepID=UPI0039080498